MRRIFLLILSFILLILIPLVSWQLARVTNKVRSLATTSPSTPTLKLPDEKKDPRKRQVKKYNQSIVPNQILVKFKTALSTKTGTNLNQPLNFTDLNSTTIPSSFSSLNEKYKVKNVVKVFKSNTTNVNLSSVYNVTLESGTSVNQAVQDLQKSGQVEYAQPNYKTKAYYAPNDYYYNRAGDWGQAYADLWALKNKLQMSSAWDVSKGGGVTVAVVDTGIDSTHPDIATNVVGGWSFITNTSNFQDDNGHGTHVAGIIAAIGNNKIGIIGVAPQAKLLAIKFLDSSGSGNTDTAAQGILYAAQNGAKVINNSWGCSDACPSNPVVEDAVRSAQNDYNATVVFAAGNVADDIMLYSPQNMIDPKPIVVASSDYANKSSFFSNFGYGIDITAPGGPDLNPNLPFENILSLASSNCQICSVTLGNNYLLLTGTSMATPYISGLAADIISKRPTISPQEVRQKIKAAATNLGPAGFDPLFGAGLALAAPSITNSVLISQIASPVLGSNFTAISGPVTITGTAKGKNFARYILSYRRADSSSWIVLRASTAPVDNSVLGTLQTGNLATGEYILRLQAIDTAGRQFFDFDDVFVQKQTARQISFAQDSDRDALSMSGNLLVWEDGRNGDCITIGGNCDIYLYDFTNNKEVQITTNSSTQRWPSIDGNRIVWQDYRSGNYEIYSCTYNSASGLCENETKLSSGAPIDQEFAQISGNYVVWTDFRSGKGNIYLYDFSTNKVKTIMAKGTDIGTPVISGNLIAWSDDRNKSFHIFTCRYNPKTGLCPERQITSSTTSGTRYQYDVHLSGNRIVWTDYASLAGDYDFTGEIYTCVLTSTDCAIRNISRNARDQYSGVVSGNLIAWSDNRNNMLKTNSEGIKFRNYDLYLYDLISQTRNQLTSSVIQVEEPVINKQRVVYLRREQGGPWGFSNIYAMDLPSTFSGLKDTDEAIAE